MQIKVLGIDEIREIYYVNMVHEFPEEEIKPFSAIDRLLQQGMYVCYGLYDGDTLEGYAFLVREDGNSSMLLDYYVVLEEYRDQGLGTRFMTMLREKCRGDYAAILVEVENPDYARDDAELASQKRRVGFYERNGFADTGVRVNLFDAEYRILQRLLGEAEAPAAPALDSLYRVMLGDAYASRVRYHDREETHGA